MRESAALAGKPAGMSFEEAAAVCDGAILALGCLRPAGLRKGKTILVYGASGSIGTAGVQLAKYFGADVTAVCNTTNIDTVRSLGAGDVIDYTQEDFTTNGQTYDVIFDASPQATFHRTSNRTASAGLPAGVVMQRLQRQHRGHPVAAGARAWPNAANRSAYSASGTTFGPVRGQEREHTPGRDQVPGQHLGVGGTHGPSAQALHETMGSRSSNTKPQEQHQD